MGRRVWVRSWTTGGPSPSDFGLLGLAVRFAVNVAALWFAQWIIPGLDIEGAAALMFGAIIFGAVNALIRPIVATLSCLLSIITLGLFTLVINAFMLALTGWVAGWFGLEFQVEGILPALAGALVISIISTVLSRWATDNILLPSRDEDW